MKTSLFAVFMMSLVAANGTQPSSANPTAHKPANVEKQSERAENLRREIDKRLELLERRS